MRISVYVDNNVWDFLFARNLELAIELPRDKFAICLTREAEFEIPPILTRNPELHAFIQESVSKCLASTDAFFGFYDEDYPPDQQRVGGFDQGRFASEEELEFIRQQHTPLRAKNAKKRPTGLYKNEADISIAARALHSVVLTCDAKKGPLNDAYKQSGLVVFLADFDKSGLSLADFILGRIAHEASLRAKVNLRRNPP